MSILCMAAVLPEMSSDNQLNLFEETFDPYLALEAPLDHILQSLPHSFDRQNFNRAKPLDNLTQCVSVIDAPFRLLSSVSSAAAAKARAKTQTEGTKQIAICKKTSATTPKVQMRVRHVLKQMMNKIKLSHSPLSVLNTALGTAHRHRTVRVLIRDSHNLRGVITAALVAYDKHVNLVLRDATLYEFDQTRRQSAGLINQRNFDQSSGKKLPLTILRGEQVVVVSFVDRDR